MPRPAKPKLPVNKTLISEVLQRVSNAKTKDEKVAILREYNSDALRKVLLCNFAKSVSFCFPPGKTPYQSSNKPEGIGHTMLFREQRMIERFIKKTINGVTYFGCSKTPRPSIQQLKKEQLWIQLLESLHHDEAELLDLVKDKKLNSRYKITKQNVIEAFPQLQLQYEQPDPPANDPEPPVKPTVKATRVQPDAGKTPNVAPREKPATKSTAPTPKTPSLKPKRTRKRA